jgi:serine/threonine-protein kinase
MFIVMEYLEGLPLDKLLRQEGAMSVERVTHIVRQILDSLIEAHKLGIVHRDLKPDNIFVCNSSTQRDFVKVFDFGIAKVVGGAGSGTLKETAKLTMIGGTVGTPAYMSPEQCCGEDLTQASDLYSLSIVIYELLSGMLPFEDANPVRTMMKQINEPPAPLPVHLATTALGKAMLRSLSKSPVDRFPSGVEFLEALDEPDEVEDDVFSMPSVDPHTSLSYEGPDSMTDVFVADADSIPASKMPTADDGSDAKLLIAVIIAAFILLVLAVVFVAVIIFQMG